MKKTLNFLCAAALLTFVQLQSMEHNETLENYKTKGKFATLQEIIASYEGRENKHAMWWEMYKHVPCIENAEIPQTYLLHEAISHNDYDEVETLINTHGDTIIVATFQRSTYIHGFQGATYNLAATSTKEIKALITLHAFNKNKDKLN